jgi:hypothetical protein
MAMSFLVVVTPMVVTWLPGLTVHVVITVAGSAPLLRASLSDLGNPDRKSSIALSHA